MTRLFLVRHAEVEPAAGVPPSAWPLTAAGRAAAERFAASQDWTGVTLVATSPEPKARDTAAPIAAAAGVPLRVAADLREVERPSAGLLARDAHVALVRRYLEGGTVDGWEPREAARERFAACVDGLARSAGGSLAVVSHGTVLALYLGLSAAEWEAIRLPDLAEVDPATRALLRPFGGSTADARG